MYNPLAYAAPKPATKSPLGQGLAFNTGGGLLQSTPGSALGANKLLTPAMPNTGAGNAQATAPVTGAVKAHTVSADGTTKTEYHPPAPAPTGTQAAASNTGTPAPTPPAPQQNAGVYGGLTGGVAGGAPPLSFPGLVGSLVGNNTAGNASGYAASRLLTDASQSPQAQKYIGQTADYGAGAIPIGQKAQDIASKYSAQIEDVGKLGAQGKVGLLTSGAMNPIAQGRAAVVQQNVSEEQQAIAQAEAAALAGTAQGLTAQQQAASAANQAAGQSFTGVGLQQTGLNQGAGIAQAQQGLQQSGLGTAIGAAQPSGNYPFVFNPLTGTYQQSTGGGAGGGTIQTPGEVAQALSSGATTFDQAVQALAYMGPTAQTQLMSAMKQVNPNFNWSQAQAFSQTQGQIAPLLQQAQQALGVLSQTYQATPWFQKTGVPVVNSLFNVLSNYGVGTGSESAKQNALSEARTQVSNALGVMTNTTPTAWTSMVEAWFPNNATPAQVNAGIEKFNQMAANRQQTFGTPGSVQPFSPSASPGTANQSALYNW